MEQHEILKDLRSEHGLSLDQLSSLTGISKTMLFNLEKGTRTGTVDTLKTLADFYKVSLDYITGYDERMRIISNFLMELSQKFDLDDPLIQKKILKAISDKVDNVETK
ncbi:helix-turn-helix transcriptional regulator [Clostridium baratii]|uniref:helix-turn-helix domain-containing protein n=1 Tax=Clostridium baratii TaxID=1561 RepID=UPI0030D1D1D2